MATLSKNERQRKKQRQTDWRGSNSLTENYAFMMVKTTYRKNSNYLSCEFVTINK